MKSVWTCIILVAFLPDFIAPAHTDFREEPKLPVTKNLVIITTDGFRWQEIFSGADSLIINDERYTKDTATIKMMYWAASPEERRKRLMPFLWSVISRKGQIYGNRKYNNKVDVANPYSLSYPGYNEMLTGKADIAIAENTKRNNPNINVLECINNTPAFSGKVAAFTSWDVFPYILNTERSKLPLNSGYMKSSLSETKGEELLNAVQENVYDKQSTRYDRLTFLSAREYILKKHPSVVFLGLGETDEFAHEGRYDLYLNQANEVDKMIGELWHLLQTIPQYRDNTTFLFTTDHGRGSKTSRWTAHGEFVKGSSEAWFAVMGPGINAKGEIREESRIYLEQMAKTIAGLVGVEFNTGYPASPVPL